jgi:predicted TIM-barrel fold metal-dependent hydrolase
VDRVSCSYGVLWNALKRVAAGMTAGEKAKLFRDNAVTFYRLDV